MQRQLQLLWLWRRCLILQSRNISTRTHLILWWLWFDIVLLLILYWKQTKNRKKIRDIYHRKWNIFLLLSFRKVMYVLLRLLDCTISNTQASTIKWYGIFLYIFELKLSSKAQFGFVILILLAFSKSRIMLYLPITIKGWEKDFSAISDSALVCLHCLLTDNSHDLFWHQATCHCHCFY